jgi:hypothetical protein
MKNYIFEQDNNFGDKLLLVLTAEEENHALSLVKEFIIKNTDSKETSYKKRIEYIKSIIEEEKLNLLKNFKNKKLDSKELIFYLEEKTIIYNKETLYSINNFLSNKNLYDKFGKQAENQTYIYFFENEPFILKEIDSNETGVVFTNFIRK